MRRKKSQNYFATSLFPSNASQLELPEFDANLFFHWLAGEKPHVEVSTCRFLEGGLSHHHGCQLGKVLHWEFVILPFVPNHSVWEMHAINLLFLAACVCVQSFARHHLSMFDCMMPQVYQKPFPSAAGGAVGPLFI